MSAGRAIMWRLGEHGWLLASCVLPDFSSLMYIVFFFFLSGRIGYTTTQVCFGFGPGGNVEYGFGIEAGAYIFTYLWRYLAM